MNATTRPYRPIHCEFHDLLEDLATARRRTHIAFIDDAGQPRQIEAVITDVYARDGEEFVSVDTGGTIRLDHLVEVHGQALAAYGDGGSCAL